MSGWPTASTAERAASVCRIALQWSTRGDSVIANWVVTDSPVETVADSILFDIELADKPRPIRYTVVPTLRDRASRDRLVAELFHFCNGPVYL